MALHAIQIATGWVIVGFVGLLSATILYCIWIDKIDISRVISEVNRDASLWRLQFLIFTVVISLSLFLVIMGATPPAFPQSIPEQVLALLGISGGSYLISKGIQFSNPAAMNRPALQLTPSHVTGTAAGQSITVTASLPAGSPACTLPFIQWSLDSPADGTLTMAGSTAVYTAPNPCPAGGLKIVVRAQAAGFEDGLAQIS
ncbi:MAG TPA: hypothetical protein VMB85_07830 [Bryobacteraceae bacterium]|nr:hypothetical protein [Bryobacteraceae bacterium]